MLNTTNASNIAVPAPEPIDPLNRALVDAKDASAENTEYVEVEDIDAAPAIIPAARKDE